MLFMYILLIYSYPKEPDKGYCSISRVRNAIENDDADQQTSGSTSRVSVL